MVKPLKGRRVIAAAPSMPMGIVTVSMAGCRSIPKGRDRCKQVIRDYVSAHDKVLYDFADIEHYDPDGTYFEFVADDCDYYESESGPPLGNWATEWQNIHTEDVAFKLHALYHTIVAGEVRSGKIIQLNVTPAERRKDIVLPEPTP